MRFVHGFFIGAKQEMRILQGYGRQWRQSGAQTTGAPGLGINTAIPHHWQSPAAGKSLRMRQEGWGKGKAQTDGGRNWSLYFQGQIIQLSI